MVKAQKTIPLGFRIIGIFKLVSAVLLAAAGFGIFRLMDEDMGAVVEHFIFRLHLQPGHKMLDELLAHAAHISGHELAIISTGILAYALLYAVEGVGILLGCHWAEYLIVLATGALLPLEIYEVIKKITLLKTGILVVNILIVMYFVQQLLRERQRRKPLPSSPPCAGT